MIVQVQMLAFHDDTIRYVNIPDHELQDADENDILNLTYKYGQNDFQPVKHISSLSVGDVINLNDKFFIIRPVGFALLTPEALKEYQQIPQRDRAWSNYARPINQ